MVRDTVAVETLALAATFRMSIRKKDTTFQGFEIQTASSPEVVTISKDGVFSLICAAHTIPNRASGLVERWDMFREA